MKPMLFAVSLTASTLCTSAAVAATASEMRGPVFDASIAANPAAECVNGYRTTHRVQGHGKVTQGVILRCRG